MTRVVAVGECMLELSRAGDGWRLGHAGDTFNTALYLARLGLDVAYLTALGRDPFSDEMLAGWAAEGLDTSLVLTDPERLPGIYAIRTDRFGERSFHYWRSEAAARRLFELPGIDAALGSAKGAGLLYLSGITLSLFDEPGRARLRALALDVRDNGGVVAFDPNYRARGWADAASAVAAIEAISPLVMIALPTFDDEVALHGDVSPEATVARWQARGAREVVVKLGPKGCLVAKEGNSFLVPSPAHIMAVDTTGAGDAFNAAYLGARRQGLDPVAAAGFANSLAGEVVKHPGAIIPRAAMLYPSVPAETNGDCA